LVGWLSTEVSGTEARVKAGFVSAGFSGFGAGSSAGLRSLAVAGIESEAFGGSASFAMRFTAWVLDWEKEERFDVLVQLVVRATIIPAASKSSEVFSICVCMIGRYFLFRDNGL
jgi:hypothetical protein